MDMEINGTVLNVELCKNSSAAALREMLKSGSITVQMKDYAHMEKFGKLGGKLPRNDEYITTEAGDVIFSEGELLVIYYAPNTWNFTRLGKIQNVTEAELREILGNSGVTVTLSQSK